MPRRIIYDPILGKLRKADITSGEIAELRQLIAAKADKVTSATAGNIAVLTANGNLADGGARSQFATAAQGARADTALQPSDITGLSIEDIDDIFPTIIEFGISSVNDNDVRYNYNTVDGWTWEDFLNSEYNTNRIFAYDSQNNHLTYDSNLIVKFYFENEWKDISLDDVIQTNLFYKLFSNE